MKTDFKGTKGNWRVGIAFQGETENIEIKNSGKLLTVEDTDGKAIAILGRIAEDEQQANAKLISCAPELLEVVEKLHELLCEHEPNWYLKYHYNIAKKVLDKALM